MRRFLQVNIIIYFCAFTLNLLINSISFILNLDAQQQQDSLELGVTKLECTVENLNLRLARLLGEYASSQAKLKQRISRLEEKYENEKREKIHWKSKAEGFESDVQFLEK